MTLLVAELGVMAGEEDYLMAKSTKQQCAKGQRIYRQAILLHWRNFLFFLVLQFFQRSVEEGRYF